MAMEHDVSRNVSLDSSPGNESLSSGQQSSAGPSTLLQFLWRRKAPILAGTLTCGLAALIVSLSTPPAYEASTLLIVQHSPAVGEPEPALLGLEAYRLLLESDFVISQIRATLVDKRIVPEQTQLEAIRDMLTVDAQRDRRDAPVLTLRARSDTPEKASAAANVWAEVAVSHFASLARQTHKGAGDVLQTQYPIIRDKLADTREKLRQSQDSFGKALFDLERRWSSRITELDQETARLTQDYEKQTLLLRDQFESRWKIQLSKKRLEGLEHTLLELESQVTDSRAKIKVQQAMLARIQADLQKEPRYWVLSKAISDEALWARIGNQGSALPEGLDQLKLRSEFLNPAHQQLLEQRTAAQLEHDLLSQKISELPAEIQALGTQADELRNLVSAKEGELNALVADRAVGLQALTSDRQNEKNILEKTREEESARLRRERDFEAERLTREIEDLQGVYAAVAPKYQASQLALLQSEPDVKIAAPAITPRRATRPSTMLNVLTGLVVGLILSALLALLVQYVHPE
jgi:uncharacterized protein involved in exopolysaccharide biosynthesis